ncbi:MAG: carbohydrate kinase family protein [Lachnospiraceae bacterium]|nr:carbohydrate kinase family protein [Lachnospiraceae bacterium]
MYDIVIIGAAIVDLLLRPVSKEVFDVDSYPVDGIGMTIGGDAANEATIITRLGHKVCLAGCVGDDVPGRYIMEYFQNNGVDTSYVKVRDDISTSINVGLVTEDGERTFVTNRQGSLWKFSDADVDMAVFEQAKVLSFASIFNNPLFTGEKLVSIFRRAKEAGMTIFADMVKPRLGETIEDIREALSYVDYFFPNYSEASLMTGKTDVNEIADTFLSYGVKNVIVKTGKSGCLIKNNQEAIVVPAYPKANCIDTTGAGDNFASGFISAFLKGNDLVTCGRYANAVASVSVEYVGATTGVTSREKAEARYQEYVKIYEGKETV